MCIDNVPEWEYHYNTCTLIQITIQPEIFPGPKFRPTQLPLHALHKYIVEHIFAHAVKITIGSALSNLYSLMDPQAGQIFNMSSFQHYLGTSIIWEWHHLISRLTLLSVS